MNKRIFIFIIALLFTSEIGTAQFLRFTVGLKGGGVGTMVHSDPATSEFAHFGGFGGLFGGIRLGRVVEFQVEGLYSMQGATYAIEDKSSTTSESGTISLCQNYFQIPFMLHLWAGNAVCFEFGYQYSQLVNATRKDSSSNNTFIDTKAVPSYNSALIGITFNMGRVVFLNFRYTYSLTTPYYNDSASSVLQVGLGFRVYNTRRSPLK